MSYQPSKWATGLVPLAILWVLGTTGAIQDVERSHSDEVARALADQVDSPHAKTRGRDVALSGDAFTHADMQTAVDNAQAVSGVRWVTARRLGVIPAVGPYAWWIVRNGDTVTTSGNVPNLKVRNGIAASVKSLGDLNDRATYGRGGAAALPAAAVYAGKILANFTRGAVTFTDGALDVSGVATDAAAYDRALALVKSPPEGTTISAADVTPPPRGRDACRELRPRTRCLSSASNCSSAA